MIEFMPWYQAGSAMVRCGGDGGCGAVLVEGDADLHRKWHGEVQSLMEATAHIILGVPNSRDIVRGK